MTHSCFHFSCSKRKPLWSSWKGSQKRGSFSHRGGVWDSDGTFSALQLIVSSGWLLSCPHYPGFLLVFLRPVNAAGFQLFFSLWLFVAVSLLHKLVLLLRTGQGGAVSCPSSSPVPREAPWLQQCCDGHEESRYRQVPAAGCCGCAAVWVHFLCRQMLGVSLRWVSLSKEGAAGGSVPFLPKTPLLCMVTGF